jgi:hypothetical protein
MSMRNARYEPNRPTFLSHSAQREPPGAFFSGLLPGTGSAPLAHAAMTAVAAATGGETGRTTGASGAARAVEGADDADAGAAAGATLRARAHREHRFWDAGLPGYGRGIGGRAGGGDVGRDDNVKKIVYPPVPARSWNTNHVPKKPQPVTQATTVDCWSSIVATKEVVVCARPPLRGNVCLP